MRSPNRTHERQSFYKYVSAMTARNVLSNRALRWSSPTLFNDPFDVPRELSFGVTPEQILDAIVRRLTDWIEHPPADTSELEPGMRLIVETVKTGIPEDVKAGLVEGLRETAAAQHPTSVNMDELRARWRASLLDFRILCLSESADHMAMWYHYADAYRGVVLEMRCVDALDSAWLGAKQVVYSPAKPEVYTADGWASLLTLRTDISVKKMVEVATYSKAPDWGYEREWRVVTYKRPADTGAFTDFKFDARELAGVYLGPMIAPEDERQILELSARYPEAQVLKASIGMDRELRFTRA
jgi:hypothetical protein